MILVYIINFIINRTNIIFKLQTYRHDKNTFILLIQDNKTTFLMLRDLLQKVGIKHLCIEVTLKVQ